MAGIIARAQQGAPAGFARLHRALEPRSAQFSRPGAALAHLRAGNGGLYMHKKFVDRREQLLAAQREIRRRYWLARGRLYLSGKDGVELFQNPADTTLTSEQKRELDIRYLQWITLGQVTPDRDVFNKTEV
jgi:hypothetical protein